MAEEGEAEATKSLLGDGLGDSFLAMDDGPTLTSNREVHSTFEELERQWLEQKSPPPSVFSAPATASRTKRPTTRANTLKKPRRVQIIGSPDMVFPSHTPRAASLRSQSTFRSQSASSVFDRLYQKGKAKVAASRIRAQAPAVPPSPASVGGTTISTLSSTDSVFERLYRREKRKPLPDNSYRGDRRSSNDLLRDDRLALHEREQKAKASLERRNSYQTPLTASAQRRRQRKLTMTPTGSFGGGSDNVSHSTMSSRGGGSSHASSSIFERLYYGDRRPAVSLLSPGSARKAKELNIALPEHESVKRDRTPRVHNNRRIPLIILESEGDDDDCSSLVEPNERYFSRSRPAPETSGTGGGKCSHEDDDDSALGSVAELTARDGDGSPSPLPQDLVAAFESPSVDGAATQRRPFSVTETEGEHEKQLQGSRHDHDYPIDHILYYGDRRPTELLLTPEDAQRAREMRLKLPESGSAPRARSPRPTPRRHKADARLDLKEMFGDSDSEYSPLVEPSERESMVQGTVDRPDHEGRSDNVQPLGEVQSPPRLASVFDERATMEGSRDLDHVLSVDETDEHEMNSEVHRQPSDDLDYNIADVLFYGDKRRTESLLTAADAKKAREHRIQLPSHTNPVRDDRTPIRSGHRTLCVDLQKAFGNAVDADDVQDSGGSYSEKHHSFLYLGKERAQGKALSIGEDGTPAAAETSADYEACAPHDVAALSGRTLDSQEKTSRLFERETAEGGSGDLTERYLDEPTAHYQRGSMQEPDNDVGRGFDMSHDSDQPSRELKIRNEVKAAFDSNASETASGHHDERRSARSSDLLGSPSNVEMTDGDTSARKPETALGSLCASGNLGSSPLPLELTPCVTGSVKDRAASLRLSASETSPFNDSPGGGTGVLEESNSNVQRIRAIYEDSSEENTLSPRRSNGGASTKAVRGRVHDDDENTTDEFRSPGHIHRGRWFLSAAIPRITPKKAATRIQQAWRRRRSEVALVTQLLRSWHVRCNFEAPSSKDNRILLIRLGLQCLENARYGARIRDYVSQIKDVGDSHVEWKRTVLVEGSKNKIRRKEKVTLQIHCRGNRPSYVRHWSTNKLSVLVIRAALDLMVLRDNLILCDTSAVVIQRWLRPRPSMRTNEFVPSSPLIEGGALGSISMKGGTRDGDLRALDQAVRCLDLIPRSRFHLSRELAVTRMQQAWRRHRSELTMLTLLLGSWEVECNFEAEASTDNRVLLMKIGLQCLRKALSGARLTRIQGVVSQVKDATVEVRWQHTSAIRCVRRRTSWEEHVTVYLHCRGSRSLLVGTWSTRKLSALVLKAALELMLRRHNTTLVETCVILIQRWYRRHSDKQTHNNEERPFTPECLWSYAKSPTWIGSSEEATDQIKTCLNHASDGLDCILPSFSEERLVEVQEYMVVGMPSRKVAFALFDELDVKCNHSIPHRDLSLVVERCFPTFTHNITVMEAYNVAGQNAGDIVRQDEFECFLRFCVYYENCWDAFAVGGIHASELSRETFALVARNLGVISDPGEVFPAIFPAMVDIGENRLSYTKYCMWMAHITYFWGQTGDGVRLVRLPADGNDPGLTRDLPALSNQEAATVIESIVRMHLVKLCRQREAVAVLKVQACVRMFLSRGSLLLRQKTTEAMDFTTMQVQRELGEAAEVEKAIVIQAFYRGVKLRTDLPKKAISATRIQACFRMWRASKVFSLTRRGFILLEALTRGGLVRSRIDKKHKAANRIKNAWHRFLRWREYLFEIVCASKLQSAVRAMLYRRRFLVGKRGCIKMQAISRAIHVRVALTSFNLAAMAIQKILRRLLETRKVERIVRGRAATQIQAKLRSYLRQCQLRTAKAAATLLQAWWRASERERAFKDIRSSVVLIQGFVRAYVCMLHHRRLIAAVVFLQSVWRGKLYRVTLSKRNNAATTVNRFARGLLCRRSFDRRLMSTIVVQAWWRQQRAQRDWHATLVRVSIAQSHVRMILYRARFLLCRQNAICIQRFARRAKADKIRKGRAAIVVQTAIRTWIAQWRLQDSLWAAATLQATWRGAFERRAYARARTAASIIQATIRGVVCRDRYLQVIVGIVLLQAEVRRRRRQQVHAELRVAAVVMQRVYRGYSMRKTSFLARVSGVIIQAWWRKVVARRGLLLAMAAVGTLQMKWRSHLAKKSYQLFQSRMSRLQATIRCYLVLVRKRRTVASVTLLQSSSRRFLCQKQLQSLRYDAAATKVQAQTRAWKARTSFTVARAALIMIQSNLRGAVRRHKFMRLKTLAILAQALGRSYLASRHLKKAISSATLIEARLRGILCRNQLQEQRKRTHAATVIQTKSRSWSVQTAYLFARFAAITIQSKWRSCRRRQSFIRMRNCAVRLEAVVRSSLASHYRRRATASATRIESIVRGMLCRQQLHSRRRRIAVTFIQAQIRAWQARTAFGVARAASTMIQSQWRCAARCDTFRQSRSKIVKLQSFMRFYLAFRYRKRAISSATRIEASCRGILFRNRVRREQQLRFDAATLIQAESRSRKARTNYIVVRAALLMIQSKWRGAARRRSFIQLKGWVVLLQGVVRSYLAVCYRKRAILSATLVEARFRGMQCRNRLRNEEHRRIDSAISIQAVCRAWLVRTAYIFARVAAVMIQAKWRSSAERHSFIQKRSQTIITQGIVRCYLACRHRKSAVSSATQIQRIARGMLCRRRIHSQRRSIAATIVQAQIRQWKARTSFTSVRAASVLIQSIWKGVSQRKSFREARKKILKLQSVVRVYLAFSFRKRALSSVTLIEARCRGLLSRARLEMELKCRIDAATLIQAEMRTWKSRTAFIKVCASIVMIQSTWRGAVHRKSYIRWKIAVVQLQAYFRSHRAIRYLQKARSSTTLIEARIRGTLCRKRVIQQRCRSHSATLIQAMYRARLVRTAYISACLAAVVIQSKMRSAAQLHSFIYTRSRIVKLQGIMRCYLSFCYRKRAISSVAHLQARARGMLCRKRLESEESIRIDAAKLIQSSVRTWMVHTAYIFARLAAVLIQSKWRSTARRQNFTRLRSQVVKLQGVIRIFLAMSLRKSAISSAILVEARVRGMLCRSMVNAERQRRSDAAIVIQAECKGRRARKAFITVRAAATLIQSNWRSKLQRRVFVLFRARVVRLQAVVRCRWVAIRLQEQALMSLRIQALMRGHLCRRIEMEKAVSAITIEKHCRRYICRSCFQAQRRAATRLQAIWRQSVAHEKYERSRRSAIVIEAQARRLIARSLYTKLLGCVIKIQRLWRGSIVRSIVATETRLNWAATRIQSVARMKGPRQELVLRIRHVLLVQTLARQWKWSTYRRKCLLRVVDCQRVCRGFICKGRYLRYRTSIVTMQRGWLAARARRAFRILVNQQVDAAIRLQRFVRRIQAQHHLALSRLSAAAVQAAARGYLQRLTRRNEFDASVAIQSQWRSVSTRMSFVAVRSFVILIQSVYRGYADRRYASFISGVRLAQATARGVMFRQGLERRVNGAIVVQEYWRSVTEARLARHRFLEARTSVIRIQSMLRRLMSRRTLAALLAQQLVVQQGVLRSQARIRGIMCRREQCRCRSAAITIQDWWRRREALMSAKRLVHTAVRVQSLVRMWHARRFTSSLVREHQASNIGATILQARVRGAMCRQMLNRRNDATLIIQDRWRRWKVQIRERTAFLGARTAAMQIQWFVRQRLRRHRHDRAIKMIQKCRRRRALLRIQNERLIPISVDPSEEAAICIQACARSFVAARQYKKLYILKHTSAKRIQLAYVTWQMELAVLNVESSFVLLKRSLRGQLVRSARRFALDHIHSSVHSPSAATFGRFLSRSNQTSELSSTWASAVRMAQDSASVVIQSAVRKMIAQQTYDRMRGIDRMPRMKQRLIGRDSPSASAMAVLPEVQRRGPKKTLKVPVGAPHESLRGESKQRDEDQHRWNSATMVQAVVRQMLAMSRVRDLKDSRALERQQSENCSVVLIQAVWRSRRCQLRFRSVARAAVRIQDFWRAAHEMRRRRAAFVRKRSACVSIQGLLRQRIAREQFLRFRDAVVTVQSRHRAALARSLVSQKVSERKSQVAQDQILTTLESDAESLIQRLLHFEHVPGQASAVTKLASRLARLMDTGERLLGGAVGLEVEATVCEGEEECSFINSIEQET